MGNYQLTLGLTIAVVGPLITLRYLRSILRQVIDMPCPAPGSKFWYRIITVLALTGSLLLMLVFGFRDQDVDLIEIPRRSLLLTTLSIFLSVTFVASRIWREIAACLRRHPAQTASIRPAAESVQT